MTDAPEAQKPARRWWLRMIVASAALVAVLLGAVWLTPVVQLHYHAWRYRRGDNREENLPRLTNKLLEIKASPARVTRLLGPPLGEKRRPDGRLVLFYEASSIIKSRSGPLSGSEMGRELVFRGGRLVEVRPISWYDGLDLEALEALEAMEDYDWGMLPNP